MQWGITTAERSSAQYYRIVTGHSDVLAAAVGDDVVGLTLGQAGRLRVVVGRLTVSERTRQFDRLPASTSVQRGSFKSYSRLYCRLSDIQLSRPLYWAHSMGP